MRPSTRRGLSRARNGLWLVAAGSSVALVLAAVSFRSPGTERAVASQRVSVVSQFGGGPGGLMAGPGASGGWSGSAASSGAGWSGVGGAPY